MTKRPIGNPPAKQGMETGLPEDILPGKAAVISPRDTPP